MKIEDFKLERYFAKYEFKTPYLLSSSDCESMSIQELLALESGSHETFLAHQLGYTESEGWPALREEISHLYNTIDASHIFCFAGAQEGIFILMNTLLEAGHHIIVQTPAYQSLYAVAQAMGCEITSWPVQEENNWDVDLEFLQTHIKANTKLIIVNSPHNPTGALISKEKWQNLVDIAQSHNIVLFSDEVYRMLEFNPEERLPAACDVYPNGVSLGVMSKAFGLAGLRIGWIATQNEEILTKLRHFKDYTTICNSAPSEFLALIALKSKEKILARNLGIIETNLQILDQFFLKYAPLFEWVKPRAGSIGFVRLKIDEDVETFCLDVIEHAGVLLLPSTLYEFGTHHFRLGFGRKNLPMALEHLEQYLQARYKDLLHEK
jgi:aspartate/methionine/tyrosine aminotransferase